MIFNHGKPDLEEMANEEMAEALDTFLESWERDKHDFELRHPRPDAGVPGDKLRAEIP